MNKICLCCGKELNNIYQDWHQACIRKMFNTSKLPIINLDDLDFIIEDNLNKGNTVTGVQKKFSLNLSIKQIRKTFSTINNEYIVKTQQKDLNNIVYYEWIGMKLASICNINVVDSGIIKLNNELFYITKRIDRNGLKKIPMEDFCQLSNSQTEYKYNGSYEKCYKNVIKKYSDFETLDRIKFYKVILFSYIIGNTDMHLKNFSLYEIDNKYQLTPFYDLVPVLMIYNQEEMALTVNGKKKNLTKNDFFTFGKNMGIEKPLLDSINNEFINLLPKMISFIKKTNLKDDEKDKFILFITNKINILN